MNPGFGPRLASRWLVTLAATFVIAYVGDQRLAAPPVLHPTEVMSWWSAVGPVVGAMSVLWAVSVSVGAYWLLLCTVALAAHSAGRVIWLAHFKLPGTAHLLRATASASILGATILASTGCGVGGGGAARSNTARIPAPPVLLPVAGAPTTTVPLGLPGSAAPEPPTPAPQSSAGTTQQPSAPAVEGRRGVTRWTVKPGDDLWSITESVLAGRLGYRPDDRQVAALWLRVVEANRVNLPDPDNPNLIFAGEVVDVPG